MSLKDIIKSGNLNILLKVGVKMNKKLQLFISFAKIGALTFGGGYAMLPMLKREVVDKHEWATEEELMDYYAIGQCTPGVIAVNTATFVGRTQGGFWGAFFATLGVAFPSLVIIIIIAAFLQNFADIPAVQHAFAGIRVCVFVLILNAVIGLVKKSVINIPTCIIFVSVFLLSIFLDLSPVFLVLGAGLAGIVLGTIKGGGNKK